MTDLKPSLVTLSPRRLIGLSTEMSLTANQTKALWSKFMPRLQTIPDKVGTDLYSLQVYQDLTYFQNFDPARTFVKWAAVEVTAAAPVPEGLEQFSLDGGLYAVFVHKGTPDKFKATFQYIFGQWLPQSPYSLDHRPHFELLGEKYRQNHPDSEEEVYIPVVGKK